MGRLEASAQSLEQLGDPSCIPALIKLLEGGVEAAQPVPGKPHLAQPYDFIGLRGRKPLVGNSKR